MSPTRKSNTPACAAAALTALTAAFLSSPAAAWQGADAAPGNRVTLRSALAGAALPNSTITLFSASNPPRLQGNAGGDGLPPMAQAGRGISRGGALGLIRMPSTAVTDEGDFRFWHRTPRGTQSRRPFGNSATWATTIGFARNLELGITLGDDSQRRDLTGNIKYRVLEETDRLPAVSIGAAEVEKLDFGHTFYGAASKHFFGGRVNATAGLFRRSDFGLEAFGGLELGIVPGVSAVVEHDSQEVNYGLRASFLRDRVQASVSRIESGWEAAAGIRLPLSTRRAAPSAVTLPRAAAGARPTDAADRVRERLAALGLENIRVDFSGASARIAYENRSYAHNEIDALANVLAAAASEASSGVERLSVVILRSDVPVLRVETGLAAYRRFMAGESDERRFAEEFAVTSDVSRADIPDSERTASSFGKADLFIRPGVRIQTGTESFVLGGGLDARPEVELPIASGLNVNVRAEVPVIGPLRRDNSVIDRAALNYFTRLGGALLGHVAAGRFPDNRDGGLGELLWTPEDGRWMARGVVGITETRGGGRRRETLALGEARYYLPSLDMSLRVTGGRFLEGDNGFIGGVFRRFGDTELGFEYRNTNQSRVAVMRLALPLGPRHMGQRPSALRIRPPDFLDYTHRVSLETPGALLPALRAGNELNVGMSGTRVLLDRDRLNRAYLLRSLPLLRQVSAFERTR